MQAALRPLMHRIPSDLKIVIRAGATPVSVVVKPSIARYRKDVDDVIKGYWLKLLDMKDE